MEENQIAKGPATMTSSLQSPKASSTSDANALKPLILTTTDPVTPKHQTSTLPLDPTTPPRPPVREDFWTAYSSLTPTSPGQHTLSLLPRRTVNLRSSPASAIRNSLAHPNFVTTANVSAPEQQDPWSNVIWPPMFITDAATGDRLEFDNDSGFSENASDTTSLESRLLDPEIHESLQYSPNSDYLFPCDEKELSEREPLTHEAVWRLRKYHANPFLRTEHLHLELFNKTPQKIIELGAGTCLWANDFGDAYPSADVEAIDSNAIALHFCKYFSSQVYPIVDDVEREWVFAESSLDFVRAGHLVPSIGNRPRLFAQSLRSLKPLCWVEFIGFNYVPHAEDGSEVENALSNFYQRLAEAMSKANLDLNAITETREELISAGFINVRQEVLRMPIGKWMEDPELKNIGELFEHAVKSAIPDIAMRAIGERLDSWSWQEVTVLGAQAKQSLGSPMYFPLYIVTGQKPASGN